MTKYRADLPQMHGGYFLTDSGLETTLIFHDGIDLPHFASFALLRDVAGRKRLWDYYAQHARIAVEAKAGMILETPGWRANPDWADKLGYSPEALDAANRESVELMAEIRDAFERPGMPFVISGNIGPRGDGYDPGAAMTREDAEAYHTQQIRVYAEAGADFVSAFTMTNVEEAIGVVRAAQKVGIPVVISFTLETDAKLPTGQSLEAAIIATDAATDNGPVYYMINCAHPTHFDAMLKDAGPWRDRIRGLRANASKRSHQELNDAPDLDDGDPLELGAEHAALLRRLPQINVLGGCCGTDHRHVSAIARSCMHA